MLLLMYQIVIILLDIDMPVMNGIETLEKIKEKYKEIKVIIISTHFKDAYVLSAQSYKYLPFKITK